MKRLKRCCICKKKFEGYGNNPRPLKENGVCCNDCNTKVVIARLRYYTEARLQKSAA